MDMKENFDLLLSRIIDSNNCVDYGETIKKIKKIKHSCICIGTGGSQAVSQYAQRIISQKNNVIAVNMEPRDVLYENIGVYKNICAFTYGGDNEGINKALDISGYYNLNRYAFTSNDAKLKYTLCNSSKDSLINYGGNIKNEYSFISIASTLIPMSILLRYYLELNEKDFFNLMCELYLKNYKNNEDINNIDYNLILDYNHAVEIMTGDNTYTACKVLESNMVEAGLAEPTIHEKYSYCHGRSTLTYHHKNKLLIYLLNGQKKFIDEKLLNEQEALYERIIILKSEEQNKLVGELDLAMKALFLSKCIAESLNKDLSKIDYAPQVKRLYRYKGEM